MVSRLDGRLDHIDSLKAVGMYLVFLGHILERLRIAEVAGSADFVSWIYSFHMPLFFFVSGIFFRPIRGSLGWWVWSKARSRLVPVLVFALICLPLWLAKSGSVEGLGRVLLGYVWGLPHLNWATWFLICLFWVELIAALLDRLKWFGSRLWLVGLIVIGAGVMSIRHDWALIPGAPKNVWFLREAVIALPFYFGGRALAAWAMKPDCRRTDCAVLLGCSVVFVIGNLPGFGASSGVNMAGASHGSPLIFYTVGLAGSCALLVICRLLRLHGRAMDFVGKNALIYLGMAGISLHYVDGPVVNWWLAKVPEQLAIPVAMLSALVMLILYSPTVWAIRRWLPGLFGMKKWSG